MFRARTTGGLVPPHSQERARTMDQFGKKHGPCGAVWGGMSHDHRKLPCDAARAVPRKAKVTITCPCSVAKAVVRTWKIVWVVSLTSDWRRTYSRWDPRYHFAFQGLPAACPASALTRYFLSCLASSRKDFGSEVVCLMPVGVGRGLPCADARARALGCVAST